MPAVQRRPHTDRSARGTWQRRLLGLALCALLSAQWLALVHSVGHRPGAAVRGIALAQAPADSLAQDLLKAVTGHEDKSAACQLFDQLVQPSPPSAAPATAASDVLPQAVPPWRSVVPAGRAARHYHARAPPLLA